MKYRIATAFVLLAGTAVAVTPKVWKHTTEADFSTGEFTDAAVNSLGEVALARRLDVLMAAGDAPVIVSAVAAVDDVIYAASGVGNDLYRIAPGTSEDKVQVFTSPPGDIITSVLWAKQSKAALTSAGRIPGITINRNRYQPGKPSTLPASSTRASRRRRC